MKLPDVSNRKKILFGPRRSEFSKQNASLVLSSVDFLGQAGEERLELLCTIFDELLILRDYCNLDAAFTEKKKTSRK